MTTVACTRTAMAADSQCSWDDQVGYKTQKIFRIGKSLFGLRGDNWGNRFIDWAQRGFPVEDRPEFSKDVDFDVLELSPDGIFLWDSTLVRIPVRDAEYAIGTGQKVALYCMRVLGKTPKTAVLEACKIDDYSKPPVCVERLHRRGC